ncbi:hypothetical protein Tco_1019155 [Tanacetum coccineum]|uniref:Uncharacterized protein n=1 Tax=Tanacetum coccineum TaxID=301880 RepID=A0ABQ5FWM1_9ASTR
MASSRSSSSLDSESLNEILECQVIDKFKKGLGYNAATAASPTVEGFVNLTDKSRSDKACHAIPPPLSGNFIPGKPDLTFIDDIVESENLDVTTIVTPNNEKAIKNKGVFNTVESNTVRSECCAPINEELVSDGKKKTVVPTIPKVDVVRPKQQEKPVRKTGNPETKVEDLVRLNSPKDEKSSRNFEVDSCSKSCMKAYATLKEQYDNLSSDYKKSQFNLLSYKAGLESVEARLVYYKKNEAVLEDSINVLKLEVRLRDNALDVYKLNLEKAEAERDQLKQTLEKFQNSSKSLNEILECQVIDKFKKGLGYDAATAASPAVEGFVNLTDKSGSDKAYHATVEDKGVSNIVESNADRMNNTSGPIIEDWNFDDESEIDYTVRPSTEKIKFVKTVRETEAPKQNPRGNQRNWNYLIS